MTFDEGFVFAARFARDGRTIIYSADWENQPRDLFVTSIDGYGSRALGYKNADLLSVSPDGALAILMDSIVPYGNPYARTGTIARASLTGGAPRRELDLVSFADFAADGSLAVSRWIGEDKGTLEWPQGRTIVTADRTENQSALPNPRVSPSGSHIAFFACDVAACTVRIATATGQTVAESPRYADWWGLAWAPGGSEVWCAVAETAGRQVTVLALDLEGQQRLLYRSPGAMTLHDVSADGKMLAAFDQVINRIEQRATPDAAPRDLSWKEGGYIADISANGAVLFWEDGDSGGPAGSGVRPSHGGSGTRAHLRRCGHRDLARRRDRARAHARQTHHALARADDGTRAAAGCGGVRRHRNRRLARGWPARARAPAEAGRAHVGCRTSSCRWAAYAAAPGGPRARWPARVFARRPAHCRC